MILKVQGKGGKARLLPLTETLLTSMRELAPYGGYIFPGNDHGHLSPRWICHLASRALPGNWTLHTLRHRFATIAYNATGHDLVAVQRALGHSSITTTQRYADTAIDLTQVIRAASLKGIRL